MILRYFIGTSFLDTNPPVRLVCGHAISRDAMKKLIGLAKRLVYYIFFIAPPVCLSSYVMLMYK